MILDSNEFKKQLALYKFYKTKIKNYNNKAEEILSLLTKLPSSAPEYTIVNGKTIPVPKGHGDPHLKEQAKLELIDKKFKFEAKASQYQKKIDELDSIREYIPKYLKEIVDNIYINKKTIESVANKVGYSKSGLVYYIDKELDKVLENYNSERYGRKKP